MKVLIKGAIIGGLVAFIWTNISWMVLPWHMNTISSLANEAPVLESLKNNVPESGLYVLPWTTDMTEEAMVEMNKKMEKGPYAYMVVHPNGFKKNMGKMMFFGLLTNIVIALILTYLLTKTKGLSYIQKVGFVKMAAVAGALVVVVPNLTWWQFPLDYTLVTIVDTAFTWGFAGLAIGKIVKE
ncbi:MAG: hypothetical protein L3K26_10975 [Candidatus Hydrogenedentes bacterium]|nr:hypothetical protein [Candidatus Hydrogenedentota bacterium]